MTNERRGSEASDQSDDGITYAEVVRRLNQSENNCDGRTTAFRNILHPKMSPGGLLGFVSQQRSPCNSATLKCESPCISDNKKWCDCHCEYIRFRSDTQVSTSKVDVSNYPM